MRKPSTEDKRWLRRNLSNAAELHGVVDGFGVVSGIEVGQDATLAELLSINSGYCWTPVVHIAH